MKKLYDKKYNVIIEEVKVDRKTGAETIKTFAKVMIISSDGKEANRIKKVIDKIFGVLCLEAMSGQHI